MLKTNFEVKQSTYIPANGVMPSEDTVKPLNPDSVYPIPPLHGNVIKEGINLFTGDVNQSYPLCEISQGDLDYGVALFYNSRSAAVITAVTDNTVGANGWKLLDYPKVISDNNSFYFLDGTSVYELQSTGGGSSYQAGDEYHAWTYSGTDSEWTIVSDKGIQFTLRNKDTLQSGQTVWHLSTIDDLSWTNHQIQLVYTGNAISSITNNLGDKIEFQYNPSGQLISVTRLVMTIAGGQYQLTNQLTVDYALSGNKAINKVQPLNVMENGQQIAVDAGYLFEYYTQEEGYENALKSIQTPKGSVLSYVYYTGEAITQNGVVYNTVHPVISTQTKPSNSVMTEKGFLYSFWNWKFDSTQSYVQWNLVKEYAGDVYNSIQQDNPEDPYGHTTYLFFDGQPANELIYYSGPDSLATNSVMLGETYWKGNLNIIRTSTMSAGQAIDNVKPYPGTATGFNLPAGALFADVSCTVTNTSDNATELALSVEKSGVQIKGEIFPITGKSSTEVSLNMHSLVPIDKVRSWYTTAISCSISALTITYIVPPVTPSVPPLTNILAHQSAIVAGYVSPVPLSPGQSFQLSTPYQNTTSVSLTFTSNNNKACSIDINCFDASNASVGSGSFSSTTGSEKTARLQLSAPATVAKITVTSTSGNPSNVVLENMYLHYLLAGQPIADDSLSKLVSATEFGFQVGQHQQVAFSQLLSEVTMIDGVNQSKTITYGNDVTLPYPKTITETLTKPNQGSSEQYVTVQKQLTYAVEQYSDLRANNLLNSVAGVISYASPGTTLSHPSPISGAVTQWKQWNGQWRPWRQFELQTTTVSNGFSPTPDSNWIARGYINQLNANDKATSQITGDLQTKSTIYDKSCGEWAVASFINADVTQSQAGWYGFENYEDNAGWILSHGSIVSGKAFTGEDCYSGTVISVAAKTFQPVASTEYLVAAYVKLNVNSQCKIGFCDAGSWNSETTIQYDANNPGWVYVQALSNTLSSSDLPTISVSNGLIDHIVFAPIDCDYSASVWKLSQRQLLASISPNGAINRAYYDVRGSSLAGASPGKSLSLISQNYSSVMGQIWFEDKPVFSDAMPNQAFSIRVPKLGSWDDFTSTENTLIDKATIKNFDFTGSHFLVTQQAASTKNPAQATLVPDVKGGDFVACAEIALQNSTGDAAGIIVNCNQQQILLCIEPTRVAIGTLTNHVEYASKLFKQLPSSIVLTLVVRGGKYLYCYADGAFVFDYEMQNAVTGPVTLFSSWPGAAFHNTGVVSGPELSNASEDGNGNEMQFVASTNSTTSNVTANLYGGNLNLYRATTLATTQNQANLSPVKGFATLNAENMTVTGSINNDWPSTYNTSPFENSMLRHANPTLRVKSRGKGGVYTASNQGAFTYSYGNNTGHYFGFPVGDLQTNNTTGPAGAQIVSFSNRQGVQLGKVRIDSTAQKSLLTGYNYDANLRKTAIFYPRAYSNPSTVDTSIFYRKFTYDFVGNLLTDSMPESGETSYGYDRKGQQRVKQDAEGKAAQTPYCIYTKFNSAGRITETGTWQGNITQITESQLNTPGWPSQGNQWSIQYGWDIPNNNELGSLGRLTSIATPDYSLWYQYNAQGKIENVINNSTAQVANVKTEYDEVGRIISMSEPTSEYDVTYQYDEQGRMISVGTATNPTAYASYAYQNGVITEVLLEGVATRTYTANANGDIDSIDDEYFSETLYFDKRHNGNPGYLNGQVASAAFDFKWNGAPSKYDYEYTYDHFGRLTIATNSQNTNWNIGSTQNPVGYDDNGNMTSLYRGATGVTFNYDTNSNQLNNSGSNQGFSYTANGSMNSSQRQGITGMHYDAVTNLTRSASLANNSISYSYDGNGQRYQRQSSDTKIIYLRDYKGKVLSEKHITASSSSRLNYIYGLRGKIAMLPVNGNGKQYALLSDHSNSVRVVVDNTKNVVAWYNYSPFGEIIGALSNAGQINLRYLYTGQEWDDDLKLYTFEDRFYDPAVCRFYSVDPLHQFASPYIYSSNPISYSDPTGEWFGLDDVIATVGGAVVGGLLETAREAIAGEKLSWKKIAIGAAVGAVVGEAALYTAGGSIFAAAGAGAGGAAAAGGGSALATAASTVGYGMAVGAGVGAGVGAVTSTGGYIYNEARGNAQGSFAHDVLYQGILGGAVGGAQSGMITAVVTPAVAAKWLGKPIAGALANPVLEEAMKRQTLGMATGAASSGANSILQSIIQGRSAGDAIYDLGKSVVIGGISGRMWATKNFFKSSVGFGSGPAPSLEELRPINH